VLLLQGQLDGASERFARAFEINPHDLLVLGNAAQAALYKRDFAAARRFYELFLRESPDATSKYFDLAAIAMQRGGAASLPAWRRYLDRHRIVPDEERWVQLATDIVKQLEGSKAARDLDQVAQQLIGAGAPAQSIPVLVGAAEREPGDPVHPFLLAHAYERGGLPAIALEELQRAHALLDADPLLETPSRPAVAYELGRLALAVNRVDLAVPHLEYAASVQPEHGDSQYALGLAYQRSGRSDLAHVAFERCLNAARPSSYREFCRKYFSETAPAAPAEPSN
jgi:tetratricopeptide (TPR) repeat protein